MVARRRPGAFAAGDDQRVERAPHRADAMVDRQCQAVRGPHGRSVGRDQLEGVLVPTKLSVRGREDLDRPHGVQALEPVEDDHHDPARTHAAILRSARLGGNEEFPTISARTAGSARRFLDGCG